MAEEIQHPKSNTFGQNVKMALMFPAATEAGSVAFAIKRSNGIKGAIDALELEKFKKLNTALKQGPKKDIFSRGLAMSNSYENYKDIYKTAKKAEKKLSKLTKKGDLPLKERFFNLFRKNKVDYKSLKKGAKEANLLASKNLSATTKAIDQGSEITRDFVNSLQGTANAAKTATSAAKGGFKNTVKTLFKKEMSSKFNLAITTLTTFVPNLVNKVVPAFKEEGFTGGIKELSKAVFQTGTDFVSYGIGGALGRTLGSAVGVIFGPVGAFVGGMFGDALGSIIVGGKVCEVVDKTLNPEEQETQSIETNRQTNFDNLA